MNKYSTARHVAGDWLWVSPDAAAEPSCTPLALQTLLGREFHHAVFDALAGFDAAAFAALSGTLCAGSLAGVTHAATGALASLS